ncbi:copper-transporting ATPase HMA4-like, partial [Primulina huaijiensis]|uniref:copper-transporting ATPase HMA4-like n=1 Tax=Primulina huaijiensis TaxID=1492673 RepID=UPI003CC765EE
AITIVSLDKNIDKRLRTVVFRVGGVTCSSCVATIETTVERLDGVENVAVSVLEGQAVVKHLPNTVSAKEIKEAVEDTGFEVEEFPYQEIAICRLGIKGKACTSCSESTERALLMLDGVKKAVVGLAIGEAKIHFDPNVTNTDRIIEAVEDAGFVCNLISSGSDSNKLYLKLEGTTTSDDFNIIQSSLESLVGVNNVEIDMEEHKATISYEPSIVGPRSLVQCIHEFHTQIIIIIEKVCMRLAYFDLNGFLDVYVFCISSISVFSAHV